MKANVGDWLVIKGTTTERSDQRGLLRRCTPRTARLPTWGAVARHRPCGDGGSRPRRHCGDTRGAGKQRTSGHRDG